MMEQTTHDVETRSATPEAPHWTAAPPRETTRPAPDREGWVRTWLIVLALLIASLGLLTALVAADQAITIWLQPQYAPFVRFTAAGLVAVAALVVVGRLLRRS